MNTLARRLIDFHHIGLTVSDLETSIRFYRDLLGDRSSTAGSVGRLCGPANRLPRLALIDGLIAADPG